jgi:RNA polymerase sigma-70 factor (ECF subfamily)
MMNYNHIAKLVSEYVAGDKSAFDKLYSLLFNRQYYYAYKMTGDKGASEDIAQEAFVRAYHYMHEVKNPQLFVKWLGTITYNCTTRYLNKQNAQLHPVSIEEMMEGSTDENAKETEMESDLHTEETAFANIKRCSVRETVDHLPRNLKSVVLLKYYGGYKETEIAEIMHIPLGTVKSRLFEARSILSKRLDKFASFMPFTMVMLHFNRDALLTCPGGGKAWKFAAARAAVPVAAAGAVLVLGMSLKNAGPEIIKVGISSEEYAASDVVAAELKHADAVRCVQIRETGEELKRTVGTDSWYGVLKENGTYTIVAADEKGRSSSCSFRADNIDHTPPEIGAAEKADDNFCKVKISDSGSGIDWDRILIADNAGNPAENARADADSGTITCSLENLPALITVPDRADNRTSFRICYEPKQGSGMPSVNRTP